MKKQILNFFSIGLLATGLMMFNGCSDPCKDVTCENGGTCDEGTCTCATDYYGDDCSVYCVNGTGTSSGCTCDTGYEGTDCTTKWQDKFTGTFNVSDQCASGTYTYQSTVTAGGTDTEISFSNFGGFQVSITGTLTSSTAFDILSQTDASSRNFVGSGSINTSGNTITMSYTVTFSDNTTDDCTGTFTRQ